MEFIPRAVIAGLMHGQMVSTGSVGILVQPQATPAVTRETINRIWADVVKDYPYQSLQFEPGGRGGAFLGEAGPDDAVIIQPPLVQVRAPLDSDPQGVFGVANRIGSIFKTSTHHLGGPPPVNLGVKIVYNVPAPGRNAVDFLRTEIIKGDEELRQLAGGSEYEASLKVILKNPTVTYTVLVEPLHADPSNLFIDLDAQFPGTADVSQVSDRIREVNDFAVSRVATYLERRAEGWTQ